MLWQYRTILFEFTKDGLLGDKYVDDEEMEKNLNKAGEQGWELVNVTLLQDGVLAFLKKPVRQDRGIEEPVLAAAPVTAPVPPVLRTQPGVAPRGPAIDPDYEPEPEPEPIRVTERQRRTVTRNDDSDFIGGIKIS